MQKKEKSDTPTRYHSPCQTPYTALRSLLSVALSSGMVKSKLMIPFISEKVNVQPFRRHCSVINDEGVQFKTAEVFNSTAIFICTTARSSDTKLPWVSKYIKNTVKTAQRNTVLWKQAASFNMLQCSSKAKAGHWTLALGMHWQKDCFPAKKWFALKPCTTMLTLACYR